MARVLIQGAYGGFNLGDELILHNIKTQLIGAGHEVMAISGNPGHTRRYHGIEALRWVEPHRLRVSTLKRVGSFDALVLGGGEQLLEGNIPNPFSGLLVQAAYTSAGAAHRSRPVFLWSVGVPEGISPLGNWMIRRLLRPVVRGTVRDPSSRQRLIGQGFDPDSIEVAPDPAFLMPAVPAAPARAYLEELVGPDVGNRPLLLFVPHRNKSSSLDYLEPCLNALRAAAEKHRAMVGVLFMDISRGHDRTLKNHPALRPDTLVRHLPVRDYSPDELCAVAAAASLVVSTRMHPLILALTQGTRFVNVSRSSKMREFGELVGISSRVHTDQVDAQLLDGQLDEVLSITPEDWRRETAPVVQALREGAGRTTALFAGQEI